jgi:hypothetical protein
LKYQSLSRRERKGVFHSDFCRINKDAELEHSLAVERLKSEGVKGHKTHFRKKISSIGGSWDGVEVCGQTTAAVG